MLHLNDEQLLLTDLSSEQLRHLTQCTICMSRYKTLSALRKSALEVKEVKPDEQVWLKIQRELPNKRVVPWLTLAAVFLFVLLLPVANDHYKKWQLDKLIHASQQLERQLYDKTWDEPELLWQVHMTDQKLLNQQDLDQQIRLWKTRNALMEKLLASQELMQI